MIKKPLFIDFTLIYNAIYSAMAMVFLYSTLVIYLDVSAEDFFKVSTDYAMYAVLILGVFTTSAWFCLGFMGDKMRGTLEKIPGFKYEAVMNVWEMYYLAWRQYTCNMGFVLAVLLLASKILT